MAVDFNVNTLIVQLQGSNGIIDKLNNLIQSFEKKCLVAYNISELDEYFTKFQEKYNLISSHYESFIAAYIDTTNENEKKTIKLFLDYCLVFLNRIQNKYSNPILYRINQINNQKSIKKANTSIVWGKISVAIGVLATAISVYFSVASDKNSIKLNKEIQSQTVILKNIHKQYTSLDSLIKFDNKIQLTIKKDCLLKKSASNP